MEFAKFMIVAALIAIISFGLMIAAIGAEVGAFLMTIGISIGVTKTIFWWGAGLVSTYIMLRYFVWEWPCAVFGVLCFEGTIVYQLYFM